MNIACIGGGPAGLYLGILVKRVAPEHEVIVFERNRPADTFGFGVVFSDATLGNLAAADPESHAQITAKFARWDDIEVHAGGEVLVSTGHGFCGLERKVLLGILQNRAAELGVRVEYEHEVKTLDDVRAHVMKRLGAPPDVIVGCDGVGSWVRDALAPELRPHVDVRPNKFVWLGCTVPFRAFTFIFKETPYGLFRVHAYPFTSELSTFIVECREDTWKKAGLDHADEDTTVRLVGEIFADDLKGASLIKNRSIWRNFPTVRCAHWSAGNVVLVGDAAHTAHFSIGSGTKLAMEDVIVLRDELLARPDDIPAALAAYEARRRPEVEALQAAAQASLEWFEGTERYTKMTPLELTYSLMTRSLRVGHNSMLKRDAHLARGLEELLATRAGVSLRAPMELPFLLGDRSVRSRVVIGDGPRSAHRARVATPPAVRVVPELPEEVLGAMPPQLRVEREVAREEFAAPPARRRVDTPPAIRALPELPDEVLGAMPPALRVEHEATREAFEPATRSASESSPPDPAARAALLEAARTAGLVVTDATEPAQLDDAAWPALISDVHAAGAMIALRLATTPMRPGEMVTADPNVVAIAATGSPAAVKAATERATNGSLVAAVATARALDFDLVVLDPVGDVVANELLPSVLIAVREAWRPGGWLGATVRDMPRTRNA
ncbi:MAG TPA: FAD-dependent monooxygenase, partial [Kofleriaceae bacterium]